MVYRGLNIASGGRPHRLLRICLQRICGVLVLLFSMYYALKVILINSDTAAASKKIARSNFGANLVSHHTIF
jgi:hypothetical protein